MAYGYFPPPFLFQIVQFHGSRFLVRCVVYILHVSSKLLFILVNDIFTRVSDLMHNADLRGRLREHTTYGVGKSVQIVCVSNKNILYTTCFQVGQNTHPESGTSVLPTHIPKTSFKPFCFDPTQRYTVLLMILPLSRTLKMIPSIHTIRYIGSRERFYHSSAA